ncbi:MAG: DUF3486 family protein [Pseudomonadales bacterium]|nr:DUF3486 family protein [Pseudomonadales bacterium]
MSRPSTIDQLPAQAREALHTWLRDPGITQTEATERLNALLADVGADQPISRHAVNRYDLKMRDVGQRLQQSRAVAEVWIAKLGAAPQGKLGHLVNEMLRTLAFDLTLKLQEGELTAESLPAVIDQLKHLSLSVARLERAASENVKREQEIRRQAAQEAVDAGTAAARKAGVSADGIQAMRAAILEGLSG